VFDLVSCTKKAPRGAFFVLLHSATNSDVAACKPPHKIDERDSEKEWPRDLDEPEHEADGGADQTREGQIDL